MQEWTAVYIHNGMQPNTSLFLRLNTRCLLNRYKHGDEYEVHHLFIFLYKMLPERCQLGRVAWVGDFYFHAGASGQVWSLLWMSGTALCIYSILSLCLVRIRVISIRLKQKQLNLLENTEVKITTAWVGLKKTNKGNSPGHICRRDQSWARVMNLRLNSHSMPTALAFLLMGFPQFSSVSGM